MWDQMLAPNQTETNKEPLSFCQHNGIKVISRECGFVFLNWLKSDDCEIEKINKNILWYSDNTLMGDNGILGMCGHQSPASVRHICTYENGLLCNRISCMEL